MTWLDLAVAAVGLLLVVGAGASSWYVNGRKGKR